MKLQDGAPVMFAAPEGEAASPVAAQESQKSDPESEEKPAP
jgi:hypothetical protein